MTYFIHTILAVYGYDFTLRGWRFAVIEGGSRELSNSLQREFQDRSSKNVGNILLPRFWEDQAIIQGCTAMQGQRQDEDPGLLTPVYWFSAKLHHH